MIEYHDVTISGVHCETEIEMDPLCTPNPCNNGGLCQVIIDANKMYCSCSPGFTGMYCEINIDDCKYNPCMNEGICTDGPNNFTCDCRNTGYTGFICDNNINECLISPCLNKGVCFDTYGSYLCQCQPGFSGQNCENVSFSMNVGKLLTQILISVCEK